MIVGGGLAAAGGYGSHWLVNLLAFQFGWFATALGAAQGRGWIGPLVVAVVISLHLTLAARPGVEARLMLVALVLGTASEHGLLWSGLIRYNGDPAWVPLWMLALWPLFATTLGVSLRWFRDHPGAAAAAGALGGPLAYWGGQALGALEIPEPIPALAAIAVIWAFALPVLSRIARGYAGVGARGAKP